MRQIITVALGIMLLSAGFSRNIETFYRIKKLSLKGAAVKVMRIIYVTAGLLLIAMTLEGRI
ncbi:MAG: hypothetical protein J6C96_03680 [Oscillospiraceae bacterium]|nr:hypothetical protein [Oscillospiraceae bacterium]